MPVQIKVNRRSPLRTVDDLEKVIEVQSEKKADVTTTVAAARRNPYFNQVKRTERGIQTISAYNIYFDKKRIQNNLAIDLDYCIFSINLRGNLSIMIWWLILILPRR